MNVFKLNKRTAFNLLIFLFLIYFGCHIIYGKRGIFTYFKLQLDLDQSRHELEKLSQERLSIEDKTKLLRPGSLDLDMLDEKVRTVLGVAKKEEKVFARDKK